MNSHVIGGPGDEERVCSESRNDQRADDNWPEIIDQRASKPWTFQANPDEVAVALLLRVFTVTAQVLGHYVTKTMKARYGDKRWVSKIAEGTGPMYERRLEKNVDMLHRDIFLLTVILLNKLDSVFMSDALDIDGVRIRGLVLQRMANELDSVGATRNALFHGISLSADEVKRCLLNLERLWRRLRLPPLDLEMASQNGSAEILNLQICIQLCQLLATWDEVFYQGEYCQNAPNSNPGTQSFDGYASQPCQSLPSCHHFPTADNSGKLPCLHSSEVAKLLLLRAFRRLEEILLPAVVEACVIDHHVDNPDLQWLVRELEKLAGSCKKGKCSAITDKFPYLSSVLESIPGLKNIRDVRNRFAHGEPIRPGDTRVCLELASQVLNKLHRAVNDDNHEVHTLSTLLQVLEQCQSRNARVWRTKSCAVSITSTGPLDKGECTSREMHSYTKNLIGRQSILKQVTSVLAAATTKQCGCRILLYGPHGVGKTSLLREIAVQLRNVLRRQYLFQATTEDSLLADISVFFSSSRGRESGKKLAFANFLQNSPVNHLLMFDDVRQPELVLSLLPPTKHCVIFTSVSDIKWIELKYLTSEVNSFAVKPLSTQESVRLFEHILYSNRKGNIVKNIRGSLLKMRHLRHFLRESMLNIPLAVRLVAYQTAFGGLDVEHLNVVEKEDTARRSEFDLGAASSVHFRGFYYAVRIALQSFSTKQSVLLLCFALSLLQPNGVPFWLAELLGYHFGLSRCTTGWIVQLLMEAGLVTLAEGKKLVIMHELVQCHVRQELSGCEENMENGDVNYVISGRELKQTVSSALVEVFTEKTLNFQNLPVSVLYDIKALEMSLAVTPDACEQDYRLALKAFQNSEVILKLQVAISSFLQHADFLSLEWQKHIRCLNCIAWCFTHHKERTKAATAEELASNLRREADSMGLCTIGSHDILKSYLMSSWCDLPSLKICQRVFAMSNCVSAMEALHLICSSVKVLVDRKDFKLAANISESLKTLVPWLYNQFFAQRECCYIEALLRAAECQQFVGHGQDADETICLLLDAWLPIRHKCPVWMHSNVPTCIMFAADLIDSCGCTKRSLCLLESAFKTLMLVWDVFPQPTLALRICKRSLRRSGKLLKVPKVAQSSHALVSDRDMVFIVAGWLEHLVFIANSPSLVEKEIQSVFNCLLDVMKYISILPSPLKILFMDCWRYLLSRFRHTLTAQILSFNFLRTIHMPKSCSAKLGTMMAEGQSTNGWPSRAHPRLERFGVIVSSFCDLFLGLEENQKCELLAVLQVPLSCQHGNANGVTIVADCVQCLETCIAARHSSSKELPPTED